MKCSSSSMDLLRSLCTALSIIAAACSSAPPLTKEELALQRRFGREVAEDRAYEITPAGLSVRPVTEPFVTTYYRRIGDDGILFWPDAESRRDPKYYAGKLSTFLLGVNIYGSDSTALTCLETLITHGSSHHAVKVLGDSAYQMHDLRVHQFHWEIINGGTVPPTSHGLATGESPDAEVRGAVIFSDRGAYLVYWAENELPGLRYTGTGCGDWESVDTAQASARLKARFQRFINGLEFDI